MKPIEFLENRVGIPVGSTLQDEKENKSLTQARPSQYRYRLILVSEHKLDVILDISSIESIFVNDPTIVG